MRRLIARALGSLALGALLAVGVGSVAASAETAASHPVHASNSHVRRAQPLDWWVT